ncbi:MAG: flagellar export chaperone FliS [Clostridia bacterium]|jgi:flagellar protein FliS
MKQENILKEYAQNNILQSTPEGLILLLYNKCISNIEMAKHCLTKKDLEKTNSYIQKAEDILYYLRSSLDKGFAISKQLDNLYEYVINQLILANIKKDMEKLDTCLAFAIQFRDMWIEATEISRKQRSKAV